MVLLYVCCRFALPLLITAAVARLCRSVAGATVAGVLVAELIVILSDVQQIRFWPPSIQYHSFVLGAGCVVTALRWRPRHLREPMIPRRYRQFSLATLFAAVTAAACVMGVARYLGAGLLPWLTISLVVAIMANPFRVAGDWARRRARLQAVRRRLRRASPKREAPIRENHESPE
ncbi:MAG: hypothetical protein AB7O62_16175 [Pirellulales bacterium]